MLTAINRIMQIFVVGVLVAQLAAAVEVAEASATSFDAEACYYIDATTINEDTVDALQLEGWAGDPGDGMEALYSPECALGLEHASQFNGPVYAWDAEGNAVDPVDEAYMVEFAGSDPTGSDAVAVEEHDCYDVIGTDPSGSDATPEFLPFPECVA